MTFIEIVIAFAMVYGYVKGQRRASAAKNRRDAERIARKM